VVGVVQYYDNIEQHQPHYNWGEHRCSKHYTDNTILNNANSTTTVVKTGVPNTTQSVFCVVFGVPVFTPVVVELVLFNIVFSV
jgi:hypothetical protein